MTTKFNTIPLEIIQIGDKLQDSNSNGWWVISLNTSICEHISNPFQR